MTAPPSIIAKLFLPIILILSDPILSNPDVWTTTTGAESDAAVPNSTNPIIDGQESNIFNNNNNNNDVISNIINGRDVEPGEFPYYVRLSWGCGGSLIAPDIVLSAAHCNQNEEDKSGLNIGVGVYKRLDYGAEGGVRRKCVKWINHPSYRNALSGYDFALCKLDSPVYVDESSSYLELNRDEAVPIPNQTLSVMGLGLLDKVYKQDENGNIFFNPETGSYETISITRATITQVVEEPYIDTSVCLNLGSYYWTVRHPSMMCAGHLEGGKGHCSGDSGGPLVLKETQSDGRVKHRQVGVVSWSMKSNADGEAGCAITNRPGVFARVSNQWQWIREGACETLNSIADWCAVDPSTEPPSTARPTTAEPTTAEPTARPTTAEPTARPTLDCSTTDDGILLELEMRVSGTKYGWTMTNELVPSSGWKGDFTSSSIGSQIKSYSVCLPKDECWVLTVNDIGGDGDGIAPNRYRLVVGGKELVFDNFVTHEFCVGQSRSCRDITRAFKYRDRPRRRVRVMETNCEDLGDRRKWTRKKICKAKRGRKGNTKVHTFCPETCGKDGLGDCQFLAKYSIDETETVAPGNMIEVDPDPEEPE